MTRGHPPMTRGRPSTVPGLAEHDVYVCGPPGLVTTIEGALRAAGVPRRRIHTEGFEL